MAKDVMGRFCEYVYANVETLTNILTTPSVPRAKRLCEVLQKTGLIERSGQGVDKIYYNCLEEGKPLPDYSKSDVYLVVLKLKGEIEAPAFYLFVDEEQGRRDEGNRLSVFHLMKLYKVKEGKTDLLNADIIDDLMSQGLVVAEHDTLHLCDAYQKKKEVMNTPQPKWEVFNQQLGVKLGVNDFISNSVPKENIDNQVFALVAKLSQRLVDRLVVKSTNREEKGLNISNVIKEKLGVNRYSILLLVSFFPEISIQQLVERK